MLAENVLQSRDADTIRMARLLGLIELTWVTEQHQAVGGLRTASTLASEMWPASSTNSMSAVANSSRAPMMLHARLLTQAAVGVARSACWPESHRHCHFCESRERGVSLSVPSRTRICGRCTRTQFLLCGSPRSYAISAMPLSNERTIVGNLR